MKRLRTIALIFLPLLFFVAIVVLTDPYDLPLVLLIVPFLLIAVFSFRLSRYLLGHAGASEKKSRFISGVITSLFLLLMLLQSIRQLTVKDFLILIALLAGVTFYFKRIDI